MVKALIRQENPDDYQKTEALVKSSFLTATHSSGTEFMLVKSLRENKNFIEELSLVAEVNGQLVGHILLTPIRIKSEDGTIFPSLALAPVSVALEFQKKGLGADLIKRSHEVAKSLGHSSVILLGHPEYYPRFGYQKASQWGIKAPFDVPDEAFMALELTPGALSNVSGVVEYPPEFSEV